MIGPALPSRSPNQSRRVSRDELLQADLELIAARQDELVTALDEFSETVATKEDVRAVGSAVTSTRRLLEQHMQEEMEERKRAASRHEALMSILGDMMGKIKD